MRIIRAVVVAACLAFSWPGTEAAFAADAGRVALVIGNSRYPDSDLVFRDVANDVQEVADELKHDNFDVETGFNLTGDAMQKALDRLYRKISQGDVALIFFGGIGIQSTRQTFLIPVDAQIWAEPDVRHDGFDVEAILGEMSRRGALVKVALVDASRRNPFERRFRPYSAGLAPIVAPDNTLVMYSAALGSVINEAGTDHGLFVRELLREIRVPGNDAEQALTNTKLGVTRASRGAQVPWLSSSLAVDFSFTLKNPVPPPKPTECVRPQAASPPNPGELARDPKIAELGRRISLNRNDQVAYYRRGRLYAEKGAYTLAVADLDEAIRLNPKDAEAYNNRCWASAVIGDLQLAIKDCNEALRLNPGLAEALDSRGLANLKLGRTAEAINDYNAALQASPRSVSSMFGRGVALQRSGADGAADIGLAKSEDPDIAKEFAGYGVFECGN
jgi:tetratricopeptide (TPR) repeat protein